MKAIKYTALASIFHTHMCRSWNCKTGFYSNVEYCRITDVFVKIPKADRCVCGYKSILCVVMKKIGSHLTAASQVS